ncbi:MAG: DNA-formamidopyrimidine glycosylase family protein [Rhodanobacter sp.]
MPEGPSIVILREQTARFAGKVIRRARGNARIDMSRLDGQTVHAIRSFGKQTLIELADALAIRIHLLMFGSFRIDDPKQAVPRLQLDFDHGQLAFYSCSVRLLEGDLDAMYDWRADVMSPTWSPALARRKLRANPAMLVCDALLDQTIFAGVGNIMKNEVLYRIRVHPLSEVGALSTWKLGQLVQQARAYAFEFLAWKRAFVLRKHWLVHNQRCCPRHDIRLQHAHLGHTRRRSFFCERCQKLYRSDAGA